MVSGGAGERRLSELSWDGGCNPGCLSSRWYTIIYGAPDDPVLVDQTFAPSAGDVQLPLDTWYQYKMHIKLNTPGQQDGVHQVWLRPDGANSWMTLWDLQDIDIRGPATDEIVALRLGGTRESSSQSSSGTKWQDDILVGATELSVSP